MSEQPNAIYKSLGCIMSDMDAISKDKQNKQQGFAFRGIDDVYNALHPLFAHHNVFILTEVGEYTEAVKETKTGGTMTVIRARIQFHFVSALDGSRVTATTVGEAMDSGDKAMNKAMSIALKYALFQTFLIPTEGADPDAYSEARWENYVIQKGSVSGKTLYEIAEREPNKLPMIKAYHESILNQCRGTGREQGIIEAISYIDEAILYAEHEGLLKAGGLGK